MRTYQDLEKLGEDETKRKDFILQAINDHKSTDLYKIAFDAEEYDRQNNITIMRSQKMVEDIVKGMVPDIYSPNHKLPSNFFNLFTTQENQYLLGNGIIMDDKDVKAKLGSDFDWQLQLMGRNALVEGVSFGLWNYDHLTTFKLVEFVPLYDEQTSALMAGIRFFQIAPDKPLKATLYELDGYTEYITDDSGKLEMSADKRAYKEIKAQSLADGEEVIAGENYPTFPIIPMWGNLHHQSEIVGLRQSIDAYDLIASNSVNNLDGNLVYWVLQNSGGMDDVDVAKFMSRLRQVGVAMPEDESDITPHEIPIPYEAQQACLEMLEKCMYRDYQALNVTDISSGNKTATEIKAAYQPFDNKVDMFEQCVREFVDGLFKIVGIDNSYSFTRDKVASQNDDMQTLLLGAQYLSQDYLVRKICAILGDPDEAEEILAENARMDYSRLLVSETANSEGETEETVEEVTTNG